MSGASQRRNCTSYHVGCPTRANLSAVLDLSNSSHGRVAAHDSDRVASLRDQQRPSAQSRGRGGRLAAGVTPAHHDHVPVGGGRRRDDRAGVKATRAEGRDDAAAGRSRNDARASIASRRCGGRGQCAGCSGCDCASLCACACSYRRCCSRYGEHIFVTCSVHRPLLLVCS